MDKDNTGLFQQRPGWGSRENRLDPVYTTRKFVQKLLETDYMNKSITEAAQGV